MPRKLPAMTDPAAASLAELAIESPLWTPFLLPTADGTTLSLFIKAHFTSHSYTILVSDFKRCWMETANEAEIARKIKTYAKSFGGTPVEKMVPFIEGYVKEQKESVKYMSVFEPDEAGQLRIHATGQVGSVSFRWVFELSQLHSDAVAPAFTPGDVLFTHLTVPTIIVAAEQERRLKLLQAVIEKKERELQECHESLAFHNVRYAPKRSQPFSQEAFTNAADEDFRSSQKSRPSPTNLVTSFFAPSSQPSSSSHLYKLALEALTAPEPPPDATSPTTLPAPTLGTNLPTLPLSTDAHMFASLDSQQQHQPQQQQAPVQASTGNAVLDAKAKMELEKESEDRRRKEREEEVARYQAARAKKKKKLF